MTWQSSSSAPKGEFETRTHIITNGKRKGETNTYQTWVAPRILGCSNGWTAETYWLPPDTLNKKGRWHMFFSGAELDGWMPLPEAIKKDDQ